MPTMSRHLHDLGIHVFHFRPVQVDRFSDLGADGKNRVQRSARLLKNIGDLVPANVAQLPRRHLQDIFAFEQNLAGGVTRRWLWKQPRQSQTRHTFATAAFPHHGERFAFRERQADSADRVHDPVFGVKLNREIADFEKR